MYSEVFY